MFYSSVAPVEFDLIVLQLRAFRTRVKVSKRADICSTRIDAHIFDNGCDSAEISEDALCLMKTWKFGIWKALLD